MPRCWACVMISIVANRKLFSTTALSLRKNHPIKIAVIGGGASGVFASIAAAEHGGTRVTVLEATSKTLHKVKISGGGRCNVMHDTSKPTSTILSQYPRGNKELNGLYQKRFSPAMAREWFEERGVRLKTEKDGRMFPITDSSQTIINTLMDSALEEGVNVRLRQKIKAVVRKEKEEGFSIQYKDGSEEHFSRVILATGSARGGYALAESLGHRLVSPVPSLFTFNCKHDIKEGGLLHGLSGVSVPSARVSLSKTQFQEGPMLITHHGLSGPAVLRLSGEYHSHASDHHKSILPT